MFLQVCFYHVYLGIFPGVMWVWHFHHAVSFSNHIYTFPLSFKSVSSGLPGNVCHVPVLLVLYSALFEKSDFPCLPILHQIYWFFMFLLNFPSILVSNSMQQFSDNASGSFWLSDYHYTRWTDGYWPALPYEHGDRQVSFPYDLWTGLISPSSVGYQCQF